MGKRTLATRCLIAALLTVSCASRFHYHRVERGETLYRISKAYGVSMDRLARANNLRDKGQLSVGQQLYIPKVSVDSRRRNVKKVEQGQRQVKRSTPQKQRQSYTRRKPKVASLAGQFDWPISPAKYHRVHRRFGLHGKLRNTGIHIKAPPGTPVVASAKGNVIYVGDDLKGYGRTVIIRHPEEVFSVYSFLQSSAVKVGDLITQGDRVGRVGRPPVPQFGSYQAMLHFELRERSIPVNPEVILP